MASKYLVPDLPARFGRKRPVSKQGGSAALRDRSAAYRALRAALLREYPLCAYCAADGHTTPSTIADHKLALALSGSNDRANLVPSCPSCNDAKAGDEKRYLARGYDPAFVRYDPAIRAWMAKADAGMAVVRAIMGDQN